MSNTGGNFEFCHDFFGDEVMEGDVPAVDPALLRADIRSVKNLDSLAIEALYELSLRVEKLELAVSQLAEGVRNEA